MAPTVLKNPFADFFSLDFCFFVFMLASVRIFELTSKKYGHKLQASARNEKERRITKDMPEQNSTDTQGLVRASTTPQTALAARQQASASTFAPTNLAEAMKFAEMVATSGMAPKGYEGKPAAIIVAIQMGMEVGLQPMQSLQNIAVINGRPSIWGDGALALVKTHPEFEWIKEDDLETITKNAKAVCVIKRRGEPEVKMTFSMEDAKKAGLAGKDTWAKYPSRMLQMRARGFAIRDAFPDALKGIITAEEAMDMPPIDGGKAEFVETKSAAPDPLDAVISKEKANSLWEAKKTNHRSNEDYKKALATIAGVDSSAKVTERYFDAMMRWAKGEADPTSSAPAADTKKQQTTGAASAEQGQTGENLDADPCEDGNK